MQIRAYGAVPEFPFLGRTVLVDASLARSCCSRVVASDFCVVQTTREVLLCARSSCVSPFLYECRAARGSQRILPMTIWTVRGRHSRVLFPIPEQRIRRGLIEASPHPACISCLFAADLIKAFQHWIWAVVRKMRGPFRVMVTQKVRSDPNESRIPASHNIAGIDE